MTETLGVGIIGFGFIGKMHTYGYRNMPLYYDPPPVRTRLVGVATAHEETAQKALDQGQFAFATTDWRELIAREDIQIINICSPNSEHCEQLLAALAAGKHVYCDKPLVVTPEETDRIEAALRSWRRVGQMTLNYRFFPPTLRAKQLIEEGFLGNVISFRGEYLHAGSVDPERPMGWKQMAGGGVLQDLGSHVIDLLDHLIGPYAGFLAETRILYPERPTRSGERVPVEVEDQLLMIARMANGACGTIEASKIATGAEDELRFEIHGDRGALRFNLMELNYLEAYDLREPETPLGGRRGWQRIATGQRYDKPAGFPTPKASLGWERGHLHCLWNFLQGVATGVQPEPSLQRGVDLQRLLAKAAESAQAKAWVEV
ncbi:MAG TPA: Gfo/Idh/MocA family oxidoreductase [Armatimonadota bacterium]|jgi:predicted dehydrogenase